HFVATLFRQDSNGHSKVVDTSGDVYVVAGTTKQIEVSSTMDGVVQAYRLQLNCDAPIDNQPSARAEKRFLAILNMPLVGKVVLDYIPVSIVYCPPDQDMTASLTNSVDYGCRLTIGTSDEFTGLPISVDFDQLGMTIDDLPSPALSQSLSNHAQSSVEIS